MNEMQFLKKYRNFMIIISLVYLIVGIALMLAPQRMGNILGFVFGAIAFVFGIYRLVVYFRQPKLELMLATDLFIGVGCTVLGFVSLLCYRQVLTYATFIFGFLLIAAGVVKMQNSINLQQLGYENWWISMILGFASIGLSVVVFVKPKPVADNFLFIMGAFFVVAAAFIVASLIMSERYYKRLRENPEMDAVPARSSVSNPFAAPAAADAAGSTESAGAYNYGQAAGAASFGTAAQDAAEFQTGAAAAAMSAAPAEAPRTGGPFDSLMFWKKKKDEAKPEGGAEKLQEEAPAEDDPFLAESSHDTSLSGFSFEADTKAEEVPAEDAAEAAPAEGESVEGEAVEAEDTLPELKPDSACDAEEAPAASVEPAPWDSEAPSSEEAAADGPAVEETAPAEAAEAAPAEEPAEEEAAPADSEKNTEE